MPQLMISPRRVMIVDTGGPTIMPTEPPAIMVTAGVINKSSLVLPAGREPTAMPARAAMKADRGSPGPLYTRAPSERMEPEIIAVA